MSLTENELIIESRKIWLEERGLSLEDIIIDALGEWVIFRGQKEYLPQMLSLTQPQ